MYFQSYSNSIELNVNHTFDLIFPNISFMAISYKPSCFYKLAIGDIVSITLVIVLSLANFEITSLNLSQNISISFFSIDLCNSQTIGWWGGVDQYLQILNCNSNKKFKVDISASSQVCNFPDTKLRHFVTSLTFPILFNNGTCNVHESFFLLQK